MPAAAAQPTAAVACALFVFYKHMSVLVCPYMSCAAKRQRRCECAATATAAGPKVMLANGLVDYYEVLGVSRGVAVNPAGQPRPYSDCCCDLSVLCSMRQRVFVSSWSTCSIATVQSPASSCRYCTAKYRCQQGNCNSAPACLSPAAAVGTY